MKILRYYSNDNNNNNSLTEELVEEILVRLPARALARFKRVCKSWNSLVNDRRFITKHLQLSLTRAKAAYSSDVQISNLVLESFQFSSRNEENDKRKLSLAYLYHTDGLLTCDIVEISLPEVLAVLVGNLRLMRLEFYHCNGILCVVPQNYSGVFFYNPALRQYKFLSDPRPGILRLCAYGFGYDPKNGDHKFVGISAQFSGNKWTHADVYTLGTESWKAIELDARYHRRPDGGVSLGGCYYWLFMGIDSEEILCFNMSEDKFSSFRAPDKGHSPGSGRHPYSALAVWNESLVFLYSPKQGVFEVWRLGDDDNRYEDEVIWIEHLKIGPLEGITHLLMFWKNNKLLMKTKNGQLMSYDLCTNKLTKIPIEGAELSCFNGAISYVESLIPV